jgi:hypothetical protein
LHLVAYCFDDLHCRLSFGVIPSAVHFSLPFS